MTAAVAEGTTKVSVSPLDDDTVLEGVVVVVVVVVDVDVDDVDVVDVDDVDVDVDVAVNEAVARKQANTDIRRMLFFAFYLSSCYKSFSA